MSASLYYRPTKQKTRLPGGSADYDRLIEVFGGHPMILDEGDISTLKAMHVASGNELYLRLSDAIEKHGSIEVGADY